MLNLKFTYLSLELKSTDCLHPHSYRVQLLYLSQKDNKLFKFIIFFFLNLMITHYLS